jgi:hypothetical protein
VQQDNRLHEFCPERTAEFISSHLWEKTESRTNINVISDRTLLEQAVREQTDGIFTIIVMYVACLCGCIYCD